MTDEEIEKEAERRLKAERTSRPSAAPSLPSKEEWLSYNPDGNYEEAMKNRSENPMIAEENVSNDYLETQKKLAEAQQEIDEKEKKSSSLTKSALSAYDMLPDSVKETVVPSAVGIAGGKALRAAMPQDKVFGTPEYIRAQNAIASDLASAEPMQRASDVAKGVLDVSGQQHQATAQSLQENLERAKAAHAMSQQALRNAQAEHAYAQTLSADDLHKQFTNQPIGISGAASLQPEPRGGQATVNYSEKFGATPEEAQRIASMSQMQQEKIPQIQKASEVGKTFEKFGNSPILVNAQGEGFNVLQDRANAASSGASAVNQAEEQRKAQLDELKRRINLKKAQAQLEYDNAQKQHFATQKQMMEAEKEARQHSNKAPISPAEKARQEQIIAEAEALRQRNELNKQSTAGKVLRAIGKIAPRFVPFAGGAVAIPEAEQAKKDWEAKNYGRALAHGVGSVGALAQTTGNPLLMGIGDIAQIPAAGLAAYDTYKELAGEK